LPSPIVAPFINNVDAPNILVIHLFKNYIGI
jgi:hypothetical protein